MLEWVRMDKPFTVMIIEVSADMNISIRVDGLTKLVEDFSSIFLGTVESEDNGSAVGEGNAETHT